jgi:hypothetical protein
LSARIIRKERPHDGDRVANGAKTVVGTHCWQHCQVPVKLLVGSRIATSSHFGFVLRPSMRLTNGFFAAAIVGLLAGCNQPAVTLKPPAFQSSENTIRDWNDVADNIAAHLTASGLVPTTQQQGITNKPATRPVFIHVQAPDSAFIQQVASRLESDLLQIGTDVVRTPAGATVVNLDVNFVRWGPRDKPPGPAGTLAAALAVPGIVIGASTPMSVWTAADAASFTALGMGAFYDLVVAATPTMNAEAVWDATVVTNDRVVLKLQEPVYVRAADLPLYAKATSLRPMASWTTGAPLPSRVLRYDP